MKGMDAVSWGGWARKACWGIGDWVVEALRGHTAEKGPILHPISYKEKREPSNRIERSGERSLKAYDKIKKCEGRLVLSERGEGRQSSWSSGSLVAVPERKGSGHSSTVSLPKKK